MSGVLDAAGVQWERCNECAKRVPISQLTYERPSEAYPHGRDLCGNCPPALHVRPITVAPHVRDAVARDAMARTPRMCECGRPERECFPPADGLARRDAYMAHCAGNTQPFTDIITPYAKDTRTPRDLGMTPSPTRAMRDTWRKS